jgi:uncharacterized membrane protein
MSMRRRTVQPTHPVIVRHMDMRRTNPQDRAADAITKFAGSMLFVLVHTVWFAVWMAINLGLFGRSLEFDKFPFGLLTMVVSLEAIFLSTFLLISQNRQDDERKMLAEKEWELVQKEDQQNELEVQQNEELLAISKQILDLTRAIHELSGAGSGAGSG